MKIVLTGGGTGGHVYPAVSIGKSLEKKMNAELHYIGNAGFIEEKIAKENNIKFYSVSSQGLEGKNAIVKYGGFLLKNSKGVIEAIKLLEKIKPDIVIGTGGFVSAPVLAAAIYKKIPYYIHEQNSIMGKVNKLFEKKAEKVFLTFPLGENKPNHHLTGIPIRFKEKIENNGNYLVFTGGSGGSQKLNNYALKYANENPNTKIKLVTGKNDYEEVMKNKIPVNLTVTAYVDNMMELYEETKIMVARSGAGSVFELATLNIPSILVPLPYSAENHQLYNAKYFSDKNAAILVEEKENFEEELNKNIKMLLNEKEKINELKEKMDEITSLDWEEEIFNEIFKKANV